MRHRRFRARTVLALVLGLPLTVAMTAAAAIPQGAAASRLPYAPYFETWTKNRLPPWPAPPAPAT